MGVREVGRRLINGVWVTNVREEDGGGNGGATNGIRLLGPYDFAFDTPNIDTTGIVLEAFSVGDVITEIWIQVFERFGAVVPGSYLVVDVGTDGVAPYGAIAEFSLLGVEEATVSDIEEAQAIVGDPADALLRQTLTLAGYTAPWARGAPVRFRNACNVTATVLTDGTGGLEVGSARLWIHAATPS